MVLVSFITGIVDFAKAHWADIVSIYLALVGLASVIVKLTPGIADDDVLKGFIRFMGKYLALNVSAADKMGETK